MYPATPDSSVYEGDLIVTLPEPYAVTFWRGPGITEGPGCGSYWGTDQTVTITLAPVPDPNQQPALALACEDSRGNSRVTRGDTITCRINKVDPTAQGAITVSGWSFDGANRRDGDLFAPEWKGVMVKSGVVQVKARLGARAEETLSANISVVSRDWSGKAPNELVEVIDARDVSDTTLMLSKRIRWAHDLGHTGFRRSANPSQRPADPTEEVRGGPNHELYYYKDLTFFTYTPVILNREAMQAGSPFWRAQQEVRTGSVVRLGGVNYCSRSVVSNSLESLVHAHEMKHIEIYHAARARELAGVIARLEEKTDPTGDADMVDEYWAEYTRVDIIAVNESRRVVDGKNSEFLVRPRDNGAPCQLKNENGEDLRNPERTGDN